MQLAGQLLTLTQPDLVQLAYPRRLPESERGAECRRKEKERKRGDRIADARVIAGDADDVGDSDDHQSDRDLAAGSPAQQRVGKQQHTAARVETDRFARACEQLGDAEGDQGSEADRDDQQRSNPAPREQQNESDRDRQRDPAPDHRVAQDPLGDRRREQHREQGPVAPDAPRWVRDPWLGEQGLECVADHGSSVERVGRKRNRPQVRDPNRPNGRPESSRISDVRGAIRGHHRRTPGAGRHHLRSTRENTCQPLCTASAASPPAIRGA